MKLESKVAIVAGGGQGIGEGIVRCLAEEGAHIAIFDVNGDTARQVADQVKGMGRKALAVIADLTEENQVNKAVQDTVDFFGKIDILVNNVGGVSAETGREMMEYAASLGNIASLPTYMRYSPDIWDRFYQVNLKSHVMLSHAVTPHFVKQRSGKIVNISSVSGRLCEPGNMPYGAMKAGDISLTWSLARGLAPYNVNVNCICPGLVYTPLWERSATAYLQATRAAIRKAKQKGEKLPPSLELYANVDLEGMATKDYWLKYHVLPNTPLGRAQTAEDMGRAVVFFVSEDAKNITGQVMNIDGGQVMR